MAPPRPVKILGRGLELESIADVLASPRQACCVALTGELGIGKTVLLDEMCAQARAAGYLVLSGRATEFEQGVPLALMIDALDAQLFELGEARLRTLGPEHLGELTAVFPSLARPRTDPDSRTQAERFRLHLAVQAALGEIANAQPVLLALEDVQWADQASLEILRHLLRRPLRSRVLIGMAYRTFDAQPMLLECVSRAIRDGSALELALGPLDRGAADELVEGILAPERRESLYRESGGNPFYLIELARAASRPRLPAAAPGELGPGLEPVPVPVRAAIEAQLAQLRACATSIARAGAVLGDPFELDLAREVAMSTEHNALIGIDELLQRDLLRETDVPRTYRFRHPIVRRAIYDAAGPGFCAGAHRRAAQALAKRGAPIAARAHHVERSAQVGQLDAVDLLERAARGVSASAPAAAARWLKAALRLLGDRADPGRRLELLMPLAEALGTTGMGAESRQILAEALTLAPDDQPDIRARIATAAAWLDHSMNVHGEALGALRDVLSRAGSHPSEATASARLELALDYVVAADHQALPDAAQAALRDARVLGNVPLLAGALAVTALAKVQTCAASSASVLADESAQLVASLSDDQLGGRIRSLTSLATAEFRLERFRLAAEHYERALRIIRATGQSAPFPGVVMMLGVLRRTEGRLADAADAADQVLQSATLISAPSLAMAGYALRSLTASYQGNLPDAIGAAEEIITLSNDLPRSTMAWRAHVCLGIALLEAGDAERAQREIIDHAGGEGLDLLEPTLKPHLMAELVRAALACGELDTAGRWVARAEQAARQVGLRGGIAHADRARAELALARAEPQAALVAAQSALERYQLLGYRLDAARVRSLIGLARFELGEPERAVSDLRLAHHELGACGAHRWERTCAAQLRERGARPRAASSPSLHTLSERERQVSRLVAHGLTNREIAARLHLSEKTVESHLLRIFDKLSVHSRAGLARSVERDRNTGSGSSLPRR